MAQKFKSYRVSDTLYLVRQSIGKADVAKPVEVPTNHIAVIDCSGSMAYDLPRVRDQLQKKLPKMMKEKDTLSIIWFSGRGQFGTLLEAEPVATLADLKTVNAAIDRWLKPVGMTGFKEPLEEVSKLVERVGKKTKGSAFALFFMSDGCDNQWGRADVLKAVEKAAGSVSSATFVEYGYYADRPLLTAMAEKAGGTLIFSEDFDRFMPHLEAALQKKTTGGKRVEVEVPGDPIGGFVYSLVDGDLVTFGIVGNKVSVPEGLTELAFLSPTKAGEVRPDLVSVSKSASDLNKESTDDFAISDAYAAVSLFSIRMKPEVVFPLLKALGDVRFIEDFSGCFGKQKYSSFMDSAKVAAFDAKVRFTKGWDPNKVPKDDAFTVLDLLRILASDDENRVIFDHPSFKYSAISRARVDSSTVITDAEQAEIAKLTAEMTGLKDVKKVKELQGKIAAITDKKGEPLKFVEDEAGKAEGYSISSLTYNEERPNVSIQVRKVGTVDLSSRLPAEFKGNTLGKVPEKFQTFIFRNYAIISNGLVNVETLPCKLSEATATKLHQLIQDGVIPIEVMAPFDVYKDEHREAFNLKALPVINRNMVKAVSAKALFEKEYALMKARAAQKVYSSFKKERFETKKSETFDAIYGKDAAAWLKEQGFTDYSGFGPKSVQAEATDVMLVKELVTSLKGLSSLPSLKDVREKIAKKKVTASAALMVPAVEEVEKFLASETYLKASNQDDLFETWLEGKSKETTKGVRQLIFEMAQIKFSIVVGQVWFTEFSSIDENSMTIDADGQKLDAKVEMKEVEIKI